MNKVFDDKSLLEFFKNIQEVIEAQKELNQVINKRLNLLESRLDMLNSFNSLKPLKLTSNMEVKE
jgi:plasmid maintenance system killer protein|tara:strand:+ start:579 stop:773 length:195 start_codon:yes stop_codon:yes gene_type:complete